jgi:hypothetical protein
MLAMFGFHFYEIETDSGLSAMLISRRTPRAQGTGDRRGENHGFFVIGASGHGR